MNKSKIISQQEEKRNRRANTSIRVLQGLCLALILLIYYIIATIGGTYSFSSVKHAATSSYLPTSFSVMVCMLAAIMVVLEFCKEIKYYNGSTYVDEDYDEDLLEREHLEKEHLSYNTKDRPETLGELDCLKKFKKQKS
tara:strand:- start:30 stop:446 length:417 start_codon:yes stop_codon:yes gene_type:complete